MDALVPRVEDVLVATWPADGPQLPIDETNEIGHGHPNSIERVGKLAKVRRPRRERALIDKVREGVVDMLDLRKIRRDRDA